MLTNLLWLKAPPASDDNATWLATLLQRSFHMLPPFVLPCPTVPEVPEYLLASLSIPKLPSFAYFCLLHCLVHRVRVSTRAGSSARSGDLSRHPGMEERESAGTRAPVIQSISELEDRKEAE